MSGGEPALAKEAVLLSSSKLPDDTPKVNGYDWNKGLDYGELFKTYIHSGFQATNFGKAVLEINKMVCNEKFFNLIPKYYCKYAILDRMPVD